MEKIGELFNVLVLLPKIIHKPIYIYIHTFIPIDQAIYLATRDPCFFSKLWVHEIFLI